jgi:hypothetical protein
MPLACKFCILTNGLKGSEIGSLPRTTEELYEHIEREHRVVVRRAGETEKGAIARYLASYPGRKIVQDDEPKGEA